jgi:hypothetical protein
MMRLLRKPLMRGQLSNLKIMPKRSMRMPKHRLRASHRKISRRRGRPNLSLDLRNPVLPANRELRTGPRAEDVEAEAAADEVAGLPGQSRKRPPS